MAFSNAGSGPSRPQINVTPLIDVLLVLILVFMVIVSMTNEKGLEALIPQPALPSKLPPREDTIVIQVKWNSDNQSSLKINHDEVKWEGLHDRLRGIFVGRADRVAFVKGDGEINFQDVAKVIDIARSSGVERVGLMTKEP
jgi:biopolymer transport protein TolR